MWNISSAHIPRWHNLSVLFVQKFDTKHGNGNCEETCHQGTVEGDWKSGVDPKPAGEVHANNHWPLPFPAKADVPRNRCLFWTDSSLYKFSTFGGRVLLTIQVFYIHSTLSALTSVLPESPQNVPSPVGRNVFFDDSSTKMSISDAKTLSILQKSKLYLQQETKIINSGERRAGCSTTSSHRMECQPVQFIFEPVCSRMRLTVNSGLSFEDTTTVGTTILFLYIPIWKLS